MTVVGPTQEVPALLVKVMLVAHQTKLVEKKLVAEVVVRAVQVLLL
jgi:hypothetical protein